MIIHQEVMVSPPISLGTSLSALAFGETRRLRDKEHLKYVASRSCLICGRQSSEPHHVRFTCPAVLGPVAAARPSAADAPLNKPAIA
jgi:hypothetical protein